MAGEAGATCLTFSPFLSLPGWSHSQGYTLNLGPPCTQILCRDFIGNISQVLCAQVLAFALATCHENRPHQGDCTTLSRGGYVESQL